MSVCFGVSPNWNPTPRSRIHHRCPPSENAEGRAPALWFITGMQRQGQGTRLLLPWPGESLKGDDGLRPDIGLERAGGS